MKHFLCFIACIMAVCCVHSAKKVTWVIDAGHGGKDVGCESRRHNEKAITLAVAKELGKLIKKEIGGVNVVFTREKDRFLTLQERCDIANKRGAALFVSIHVNSAANTFARGTETYFATNVPLKGSQSGKSELLALLMQKQYLAHGRAVSRGVKQRELYVCEHTNMPSVLTELGFISNLNEEAYLTSKAGQKELAQSICNALKEWKEMTKKGTVSKRELQRLRFSHYAPVTMASTPEPQPAKTKEKTKEPTKAQTQAEEKKPAESTESIVVTEAAEVETVRAATAANPETESAAATSATAQQISSAEPAQGRPYFSIQLMNTAAQLKDGDYRLKGFKGVKYLPANGRFKVLYGHSESYRDIKNKLVNVRETFPEAFIVSFIGERQITTSEALQLTKK